MHAFKALRGIPVAAFAAVGLSLVCAAVATASWAPETVISGSPLLGDPRLFAGPSGELLSWSYSTGLPPHQRQGAGEALAGAGLRFGPPRRLQHGYNGRTLVDLGDGHVAQLILTPTGSNTSAAAVALGSTAGAFGHALGVRGSVFAGRASLAGDARGDLLLAWISADRNGYHRKVWASVRPAGRAFGPPQLLNGSAETERVQAGLGARGAMAIAFATKQPHGRMFARVRVAGRGWGPQQNIGPAAVGTESDVSVFVTTSGEAVVAWYHTQLCSGGCESPGYVRVAVQPAGARRFAPAQLLRQDRYGLNGASAGISLAPALAAPPGRPPLVAFLARVGSPGPSPAPVPTAVMVAVPSGSRYGAPRTISPPGQVETDVAAAGGPHGVLVTWIRREPLPRYSGPVFAAVGDPRSGRFGAPEQVSPDEESLNAVPVFNPAGRWPANTLAPWTVAWTARPLGGFGLSVTVVTEALHVSTPVCPLPPGEADPACAGF